MSTEDEKKRGAICHFIGKLVGDAVGSDFSYEELGFGYHLYAVLERVAPAFFCDGASKMEREGISSSWVLRKTNLTVLVDEMTRYAQVALSASADFDINSIVDVTAVAKQEGADQLGFLCDLVFVMAILSGNTEAISVIKGVAKDEQTLLNQIAKKTMGLHGLKPAKKGVTPGATGSTGASGGLTPTVASAPGLPNSTGLSAASLDRNHSDADIAVLQNEIQQLRNQLRDRQSVTHDLETRVEVAERERQETQERYRSLLEESEQLRSSSANEKQWSTQMAKKEETIRELTNAVKDLTQKLQTLKEKYQTAQDELDASRTKCAEAEQIARAKSEEKQELSTQLAILQDRYDVSMRSKKEQSEELAGVRTELERTRAELAVLQSQDAHHSVEGITSNGNRNDATLEDENAELRSKLKAVTAELHLLRTSGFSASPQQKSELPLDATPDRSIGAAVSRLLDDTVTDSASELQAELAKAHTEIESLHEALSLRDRSVLEMEKKSVTLEGHLQRSCAELESARDELKRLSDINATLEANNIASARTQQLHGPNGDALKKENNELLSRLQERSEVTRKEQAILVSTVVHLGHKNLMLQQRQLLANSQLATADSIHKAPASSTAPGGGKGSSTGGTTLGALNSWFLGIAPAQDTTEIPGSFLTKQRRHMERGLLDALLTAPVAK